MGFLVNGRRVAPDSVASDSGRTPPSYASERKHTWAVVRLLDTKAVDTERVDHTWETALDHAKIAKRKADIAELKRYSTQLS